MIQLEEVNHLHILSLEESTAVLAGNSLLTMAFEILSHKGLNTLMKKLKLT